MEKLSKWMVLSGAHVYSRVVFVKVNSPTVHAAILYAIGKVIVCS